MGLGTARFYQRMHERSRKATFDRSPVVQGANTAQKPHCPLADEEIEKGDSRRDDTCSHTYFDGRSAVTQVKWSDKGFVGRCNLCGDVIEK